MPSQHETSLPALSSIASSPSSNYDQVQALALRAAETWNKLGIESFEADSSDVRCVGSSIIADEAPTPDMVAVTQDGMVRRQRQYPAMTVAADFVRLWPATKDAALYSLRAPLALDNEYAQAPFTEVAGDILAADSGYSDYARLETNDGKILFSRRSSNAPGIVALTTKHTHFNIGVTGGDTADGVKRVDLRIRMLGHAGLLLPGGQYMRLDFSTLQRSSGEQEVYPVYIPLGLRTPVVAQPVRVPISQAAVRRGANGQVLVPGADASQRGDRYFPFNPRVTAEVAWRLLARVLPWTDITAEFAEKARKDILARCAIDPGTSYQAALSAAHEVVTAQLPLDNVQPSVLGCLAVRNKLAESGNERLGSGASIVDQAFFETLSQR